MPKRKFLRRKSTASKKARTVSVKVKNYVKRQIDKNIEDNMYMADLAGFFSANNDLILTPAASTLPQVYSLVPSIAQGDGLQNRSGTRVRIKREVLEIDLRLSGASLSASVDVPMNIYYFVLQDRDTPASLSASDLNNLFYYSGGTTQFLSGSGYATTHNLNDDYFKIIKTNYPNKPIKLGWSQYSSGGLFSNNDYKSMAHLKIDLTSKVVKTMHFNNTTAAPTDHNWYLCIYVQKMNLDTTTVNWDPPLMYVTQCIKYENA